MALDTIACSCAEVKVHFATSSVYPFHLGIGVWKLGDGVGLLYRAGGRVRGSGTILLLATDEKDVRRGPGELTD